MMIGVNKNGVLMTDKRSGEVLHFGMGLKDAKRFEKLNESRNNEFELMLASVLEEKKRRNKIVSDWLDELAEHPDGTITPEILESLKAKITIF